MVDEIIESIHLTSEEIEYLIKDSQRTKNYYKYIRTQTIEKVVISKLKSNVYGNIGIQNAEYNGLPTKKPTAYLIRIDTRCGRKSGKKCQAAFLIFTRNLNPNGSAEFTVIQRRAHNCDLKESSPSKYNLTRESTKIDQTKPISSVEVSSLNTILNETKQNLSLISINGQSEKEFKLPISCLSRLKLELDTNWTRVTKLHSESDTHQMNTEELNDLLIKWIRVRDDVTEKLKHAQELQKYLHDSNDVQNNLNKISEKTTKNLDLSIQETIKTRIDRLYEMCQNIVRNHPLQADLISQKQARLFQKWLEFKQMPLDC